MLHLYQVGFHAVHTLYIQNTNTTIDWLHAFHIIDTCTFVLPIIASIICPMAQVEWESIARRKIMYSTSSATLDFCHLGEE